MLRALGGQMGDPAGALCDAASTGNMVMLQRLLEHGVDPNVGDYDNRTPFHLAAAEGQQKAVEYLLNAGAKVNVKDRWGGTPLMDAISSGQPMVRLARTPGLTPRERRKPGSLRVPLASRQMFCVSVPVAGNWQQQSFVHQGPSGVCVRRSSPRTEESVLSLYGCSPGKRWWLLARGGPTRQSHQGSRVLVHILHVERRSRIWSPCGN